MKLFIVLILALSIHASIGETLIIRGSTAIAKVMDAIIEDFEGDAIYEPQGSGAGIKCALNGMCDLGASDVPIPKDDWVNGTLTIPILIGGVAVAHNVLDQSGIRLDACDLARIYSGKIKSWGVESILQTQTVADLSDNRPIFPIAREGPSGTNELFTRYLSTACPVEWPTGSSLQPEWPPTVKTTKSTSGMIADVLTTENSIGYANIGRFPSEREIAIESADGIFETSELPQFGQVGNMELRMATEDWSDIDFIYKPGAYPITFVEFFLVQRHRANQQLIDFLNHVLSIDVQISIGGDSGFRGLPENLRSVAHQAIFHLVSELEQNPIGN